MASVTVLEMNCFAFIFLFLYYNIFYYYYIFICIYLVTLKFAYLFKKNFNQVLCCVDKKGVLSWPNPTAEKVFFLKNGLHNKNRRSTRCVIIFP